MPRIGFLACTLLAAFVSTTSAQPITRADLKPGLLLTVADAKGDPFTLTRIEPGVALSLAPGEAPHPRSAGGDTFKWQGTINILIPGAYKFDAVLLGKIKLKVGNLESRYNSPPGDDLSAAVKVEGAEMQLAAGIQPFEVEFTRTGKAARVELIWSGPQFRPEPIPYFFFGHLPKNRPATLAADVAKEHGRLLFEELSCIRCHKPDAADKMAKTLVERSGPNLTQIGNRAFPGWLDAWLADPQNLRPRTAMPKMFADDATGEAERFAVVSYLTSLGGPLQETRTVGSAADIAKSLGNGQKLYLTAGCAACHGDRVNEAPTVKKLGDDEDEKPTAKPEDSFYGAGTAGPRGYYRLGAVGSKFTPTALANFLKNPLATNPHGRMPNLMLNDQEAIDLSRFLCKVTDPKLATKLPKEPELDPIDLVKKSLTDADAKAFPKLKPVDQWKLAGMTLLTAKGCVNCHAVEPGGKPLPVAAKLPTLADVRKSGAGKGCLADKPTVGTAPGYTLTAAQKAALADFLKDGLTGPGSPAPAYQARLAVKRFNCLNCHNRDGEGGIDEALSDQMKALEKAENADDVQPPRLTSAGHKLRTPWLKQVLTQAGRIRPWMSLRMPQYGDPNVGFLAEALPKLEGTVADETVGKVVLNAAKLTDGRTLTGKATNGLGCISCHDISGVQGGGTRGPDLATLNQRVRFDWYSRWMHQPQRLAPGTKMPQNFLDGKSQITAILAGDGDAQIEAIWSYLSLGPGLPLPAGIEPPGKSLTIAVKERPEVLRTFMPDGAGTKAIAVGYPGGVNLVFDAATCRLSYAWTGNFLDAAPVWNGRGGSPANLLGPKFWFSPTGNPWAATDSRTPPDFTKRADDPAYGQPLKNDEYYGGPRHVRFIGYTLDAAGNPAFRYALTDADDKPALSVIEKPAPLPVTVAAGISRTFAIEAKAGKSLWFNAGNTTKEPRVYGPTGAKLDVDMKATIPETPAIGSRVVLPQEGSKVTVLEVSAAPPGTAWHFAPKPGGGWLALIRLPEGEMALRADFTLSAWGLPQDDEQLLKGLKK